jgi:NAD(P)-dependent dehydrogenase (short-subunit alcohol dehydrogenase family)
MEAGNAFATPAETQTEPVAATKTAEATAASSIEPERIRVVHSDILPGVVVTGVSSGIGFATAKELASYGYQVFGTVRSVEDGARVRAALGYAFHPVIMDVTDVASIQAAVQEVSELMDGESLAGLINNAGIAVAGPLMHVDLADLRRQLEVNVVGLVAVTQAFLPLLGARAVRPQKPGRIINIGSVSGHTTYPFLAPYAASKHAVEALTEGLRRELMIYGIDVSVMVLGAVQTPIWEKADQQALVERYTQTAYAESAAQMQQLAVRLGREGMPVERVGRAIRLALESSTLQPRYVLANNWWLGWWLPRRLPARWMDWVIARQFGLTPKALARQESDSDEAS